MSYQIEYKITAGGLLEMYKTSDVEYICYLLRKCVFGYVPDSENVIAQLKSAAPDGWIKKKPVLEDERDVFPSYLKKKYRNLEDPRCAFLAAVVEEHGEDYMFTFTMTQCVTLMNR